MNGKLTSRKFWLTIAAIVVGLLLMFCGDDETIERVIGALTSLGSVIAYIAAESGVDKARATEYEEEGENEDE